MNRKMRAARNNQAAKARKRAKERVMDEPRCHSCGDPESDHVAMDVPLEVAEALHKQGAICDFKVLEKEKLH